MKTVAWDSAPQIALRDCSKDAVEGGQYIIFWLRRCSVQSSMLYKDFFLVTVKEFVAGSGTLSGAKKWTLF